MFNLGLKQRKSLPTRYRLCYGIKSRTGKARNIMLHPFIGSHSGDKIYLIEGLHYVLCRFNRDEPSYKFSDHNQKLIETALNDQLDRKNFLVILSNNNYDGLSNLNEGIFVVGPYGPSMAVSRYMHIKGNRKTQNWLVAFKNKDEQTIAHLSKMFGVASSTEIVEVDFYV